MLQQHAVEFVGGRETSRPTSTLWVRHRNLILYAFIGGSASALDLGLFSLLYLVLDWPALACHAVSVPVAVVYSFTLNATLNFRTTDEILARLTLVRRRFRHRLRDGHGHDLDGRGAGWAVRADRQAALASGGVRGAVPSEQPSHVRRSGVRPQVAPRGGRWDTRERSGRGPASVSKSELTDAQEGCRHRRGVHRADGGLPARRGRDRRHAPRGGRRPGWSRRRVRAARTAGRGRRITSCIAPTSTCSASSRSSGWRTR